MATETSTTTMPDSTTPTTTSVATVATTEAEEEEASSAMSAKQQEHTKCVSFDGDVTVREFGPGIGDNPSVSNGAPIALNYDDCRKYVVYETLEMYEDECNDKRRQRRAMAVTASARGGRGKKSSGLVVDKDQREQM